MSDIRQVNDALDRIFNQEGARIVFWNDPEGEFLDFVNRLFLTVGSTTINMIRVNRESAVEVKIRLERKDAADRYLLYSASEEPDYEDDWLLDIRLYSRSFRADRASIILDELGLKNQHLREHLNDRRKFFDNKERLQKLKSSVAADDIATDLDRKMIAIVAKAEQPELFNIIQTLFHAYNETDGIDLDDPPAAWQQIEKFDLAEPFWEMVKSMFGYTEDNPTLKKFLIRLLVTDYAHNFRGNLPAPLVPLVLPPQGRSNAFVCLGQWRDSSTKGVSYDRLSAEVASLIHLEDHLDGFEIGDICDVMTFLEVEKRIASSLRDRVQSTAETVNVEEVREIARRRQAGHWASSTIVGAPEVPRKALHAVYDALVAAGEFFSLKNRHQGGFDFSEADAIYRAYEDELYRFDQLYRHFCEAADQAESQGWNILKSLRDSIDACYTNWYLPKLAFAWGKFVDPNGRTGMLMRWKIDNVPNQQDFFVTHVGRRLEEAENRKVYVVISDAFRYEAAEEMCRELNGKYRFEATLTSQLGVLPSYTPLGMASLLPHKMMSYRSNGEVLVDGKPTLSTDQRDEVLRAVDGMACKFSDLLAKKKDEGREFVSGKRLVYVYHNKVDAIGDDSKTEGDTFNAVREAINELAALVTYIINNLNGNYVVITADHGFLFAESAPGEPERTKLTERPEGTVLAKKRYLIGRNLPDDETVWHGHTDTTAGTEGGMEFLIPRGFNRFHFVGGARFVHGGAMLQEVVVPVITIRQVKGRSVKETRARAVSVHVLGGSHKITANRHRFELIQVEPVSDRVKPVTLKVAIYEGDEPITNIETLIFDSSSDKIDERKKWVSLVLQDREYNKKTAYRLVLRDTESGVEHQSVPVVIDRAFTDDF